MPERVAVNRIVVGDGENRKAIAPGTRFNTEDYNISAEQLEKWDKNGTVREPRDQARAEDSPREHSRRGEVVEDRTPVRSERGETEVAQPRSPPPSAAGHPAAGQPARPEQSRSETRRRGDAEL